MNNNVFDYETPPDHLSDESKAIWNRLKEDYTIDESWYTALIVTLETLDHIRELEVVIKRDGLTSQNARTKAIKPHPLLASLDKARTLFVRSWKNLNLDVEPPKTRGY